MSIVVARNVRRHVFLDGESGTYVSTPDSASLSVTGDLEIRVRVETSQWASGFPNFVAKYSGTGATDGGYRIRLSNGNLVLSWTESGGASSNNVDFGNLGLSSGDVRWVRVTLDVDDGGGNHVATAYTSTDTTNDHASVSWTQFNSSTVAGTTSIEDNAADLRIGTLAGTTGMVDGKIYAAAILDGIDGTVVADVRFDEWPPGQRSGTYTGHEGNVWTLNGNARIAGGHAPVTTFGMPQDGIVVGRP